MAWPGASLAVLAGNRFATLGFRLQIWDVKFKTSTGKDSHLTSYINRKIAYLVLKS
jgi:hypothetical protein